MSLSDRDRIDLLDWARECESSAHTPITVRGWNGKVETIFPSIEKAGRWRERADLLRRAARQA